MALSLTMVRAGEVSPNIVNCAFDGNTSATSGAAIYNYGYGGKCSPTITSCVFNSNSASSMGGAIYNTGYGGTVQSSDHKRYLPRKRSWFSVQERCIALVTAEHANLR